MRTLLFSVLLSTGVAIAGTQAANAAPAGGLVVGDAVAQTDALTLVRDGCGRGRHFSRYRGICVWDRAPGYYGYYAPRPYYYGYAPGYYYAPPVVYGSPYGYYGYRRYYW